MGIKLFVANNKHEVPITVEAADKPDQMTVPGPTHSLHKVPQEYPWYNNSWGMALIPPIRGVPRDHVYL